MRVVRTLVLAIVVAAGATPAFAQTLPPDASPTCTANIAPWFASGSITANGAVNPANSLTLNTSNNCNFYLWSEQMFLWMTSPASSIYGGVNDRVFQSPVFFGVIGGTGGLQFVPQFVPPPKVPPLTGARAMKQMTAALRPAKLGPHGLPVVLDRKGRTFEVVDARRTAKDRLFVLSRAGARVEAARVAVDGDHHVSFFDAAGKVIAQPRPALDAKLKGAAVVQRFVTATNEDVFIDERGTAIDVSPEQAGSIGAVLLAQSNSVIYYTVAVNDVYAWFLTGVDNGAINTNNQFPTTQSDLNQIVAYAGKYGVTFPDANALAIEAKLSWVEASTLPNPGDYITTQATVPVYNTSNPQSWPQINTKSVTLALLGVHIVGSTVGHPEMLWASFEHFGNTPNAAYQYVNKANATVSVPQTTLGKWTFSQSGSTGPFNVAYANYKNPPAITAQPGQKIGPSNTLRENPFGVAPTGTPNQNDATPAIANTEVLSLNNSVLGQLASGDMRKNYYFLGTTWTFGGAAPTSPYPVGGNEIGTSYLANSTMETYEQRTASNPGANCLDCHRTNSTDVSHIFDDLAPLFKQ